MSLPFSFSFSRRTLSLMCASACALFLNSCGTVGDGSDCGAFAVDSLTYERNWTLSNPKSNDPLSGRLRYSVKVDVPIGAEEGAALADSVYAWIASQLLLQNESTDAKGVKLLDIAANQFFNKCEENEWGEEVDITIKRVYDADDYVSYEFGKYDYTGGVHGNYQIVGATFVRSTGRMVVWSDFNPSDALRKTVTAELLKAKGVPSSDALSRMLLVGTEDCKLSDGSFAVPMPKTTPWLTDLGWVFTYQPMEILPWSHGAPACCIADKDLVSI